MIVERGLDYAKGRKSQSVELKPLQSAEALSPHLRARQIAKPTGRSSQRKRSILSIWAYPCHDGACSDGITRLRISIKISSLGKTDLPDSQEVSKGGSDGAPCTPVLYAFGALFYILG